MPWYWNISTRVFAHSPFGAKLTLPTTVSNSLLRMYSPIAAWSMPLVAVIACASTWRYA